MLASRVGHCSGHPGSSGHTEVGPQGPTSPPQTLAMQRTPQMSRPCGPPVMQFPGPAGSQMSSVSPLAGHIPRDVAPGSPVPQDAGPRVSSAT